MPARTGARTAESAQLLPIALALTVLDAVLTLQWLRIGVAVEANPWLAALIEDVGAAPAMAVRTLVGAVLVVALAGVSRTVVSARRGLLGVSVVLGAVVAWHVTGGFLALAY